MNKETNKIKQSLHKRRLKGGCGMWRYVGIPYLYHTKQKKHLYPFEIKWYEDEMEKGIKNKYIDTTDKKERIVERW